MNILGSKQNEMLDGKISVDEFNKLYFQYRNIDENKWFNKLSVEQRQSIHSFILMLYKIKNRIGGYNAELVDDKRKKTILRPQIFACSHVGKFDIEVISELIKDHYYLLSGDYEHIQGIMDLPFMYLNGILFFNEYVKEERGNIQNRMIDILNKGGNLLYFPEGTWNMSPNLPMLPCYWGIIDVARQGNASIVPIGTDQYGKTFKVNIGENFEVSDYPDTKEGKLEAIRDLRDTIASLKWEIWESNGLQSRCDLTGNEWNEYKEQRYKEWPFNDEYISNLVYKPKGVNIRDEVFKPIRNLYKNNKTLILK